MTVEKPIKGRKTPARAKPAMTEEPPAATYAEKLASSDANLEQVAADLVQKRSETE